MQEELMLARKRLNAGNHTCVLYKDGTYHTSNRRGIAPLLSLYDSGMDTKGFYAADKVVGKGAAFMYVLMGIKALYATVLSQSAKQVLDAHGIYCVFDQNPPRILNRDKTGFCPIESAVQDISDPEIALSAIRLKVKELSI